MKQSVFILLLVISFNGSGQVKNFNFKVGSIYELPRNADELCYISNKKDGIVNLSVKGNKLNIVRFDPETLEKTAEIAKEFPDVTSNFNGELAIEFGGNNIWIHSDWNRESKTEYLLYDKVDVATGDFIEKDVKILESSKISGSSGSSSRGLFSFRVTGKYQFRTDTDGKKLLIAYKLIPKERKDKNNFDVICIYVCDDAMKKLWSYEYTMQTNERQTDIMDYSIDSKGNVYIITKIFDTEKRLYKDASDKPAYYYQVSRFSKESKEPVITKLDIGNYFIREANIVENPLHEMVVCGTYAKKSPPQSADGLYMAILNNEGNLRKDKGGIYEFPLSELSKYESSKTKRKIEKKDEDYEAPNTRIRAIFPATDGSIFIASEEFISKRIERKDYDHTFYYFLDIYCMKIDKKGAMEWFTKIPKEQLGTDSYQTLGFKVIPNKNNYYFLYIDNKKNIDLTEDDEPKEHINGYGGQVIAAKVDEKGKLSREIVFYPFDEKMMILPTTFTTFGGNKFLGRAVLAQGTFRPILISAE